jgi:hypothetical protein
MRGFIKEEYEGELVKSVTRVEVIDQDGRSYVNWNSTNKVEVSLQDEGKTMKVFIRRSQ